MKIKANLMNQSNKKLSQDQGSIILLSAVSLVVLLGFALIALNIGRMYILKRELQTANDAAALTSAFNVMEIGLHHQDSNVNQLFPRYYSWLGNIASTYDVRRYVNRDIYTSQNRTVITVGLTLQHNTHQSLFSGIPIFNIRTTAQAQINENIFDLWPMIVFMLDRSGAMNDPLPGDTRTAFEQMRFIMEQWRNLKLPVRSGMVLFSAGIDRIIPPNPDNQSSDNAMVQALYEVGPSPSPQVLTDIAEATMQARDLFTGLEGGKNAIIISDGEATASTHCNIGQQQTECPRREARDHGCRLRGGNWTGSTCAEQQIPRNSAPNTWAAEVRRVNYDPKSTETLQTISGPAGGGQGTGGWFFAITDVAAIESFFNSVANSVCTFGPLRPKPGSAPTPPYRFRGTNPRFSLGRNLTPAALQPQYPQRRVYVLIRNDITQREKPLRYFDNIENIPDWSGFTTSYNTADDEVYVRLTRQSCQDLASYGPEGSLVIRWGDPEIIR